MLVIKKRVPTAKIIISSASVLSVIVGTVLALPVLAASIQTPVAVAPTPTVQTTSGAVQAQATKETTETTSQEPETTNRNVLVPKQSPMNSPQKPINNTLTENFNGDTLNADLWEAVTLPKGYRNHEEQDYRPSQVKVDGGMLRITATRDSAGEWHSGEVHSKWDYMYGDFEVRAALTKSGPGVWPAAWLMGTTEQWPDGGEIDIFENINGAALAYGTIHAGGDIGHWKRQAYASNVSATRFHTYKISKKPGIISWWVDGVKYGEWSKGQTPNGGTWPFETHRNFGLLNLAIGGDWPGPSDASTPDTITMLVDYFSITNGE